MQTRSRTLALCVLSLFGSIFVVNLGCNSDPVHGSGANAGDELLDAADSKPLAPSGTADSSPQGRGDAEVGLDSGVLVDFAIGDGGKATCSPVCSGGKACSYSHQCLTASTCPAADVGISCAPGVVGVWMANGKDKINKLEKVVLCVHKQVTAKIFDAQGKIFLTVPDVFCKQTNLNDYLAPGLYYGEFYDALGNVIVTPDVVHEDLLIE